MNNNAYVIAVSGSSGAGKTSIVQRTAELLGNATVLHFDDYSSVSSYPQDLKVWMDRGADVREWRTPQLVEDLRALRSGSAIALPKNGGQVDPADVIVIEEPFGRLRKEMSNLIDLAAHVDVPLDILIARRLLRRLREEREEFGAGLVEKLQDDLHLYLNNGGRDLAELGGSMAKKSTDIVLDGTGTVDELAATLIGEYRYRILRGR